MPTAKRRTALEEAEWEDESEQGALDRELMLQCELHRTFIRVICADGPLLAMETLRVFRPRVLIHGPSGMGQNYIATAALHHLEGFSVQNLDLGTLLGDSTRVRASYH